MPLVKVNMLKGKDIEYKKIVLDSVHNGLVSSLGIEDWDRFQRIIEFEKSDFETSPEKTDVFIVINEPPLENCSIFGRYFSAWR